MSRIPRTPVHFPRMKVRGRRNRAKSAARIETAYVIPSGTIVANDGGRYTIRAGARAGVATHAFRFSQWHDGWGRPVRAPNRRPVPKIARSGVFSISLQLDRSEAMSSLFNFMTGRKDE